jgi:RNA polymerase sigma factor for flagellar operon FliA
MGVPTRTLDVLEADIERAAVLSLQMLTSDSCAEILPSSIEGPEGVVLRKEELAGLRRAVSGLPDRLRLVIEQYFLAQRKMTDIAADLGVSESRVSQLRAQALVRLRADLAADFDEYRYDSLALASA